MKLFTEIKLKFYKIFNKNKFYKIICNVPKDLPTKCKKYLVDNGKWYHSPFIIKEALITYNNVNYKMYYNPDYNGVGIYVNNEYFVKMYKNGNINIDLKFQQKYSLLDCVFLFQNFAEFIIKNTKD